MKVARFLSLAFLLLASCKAPQVDGNASSAPLTDEAAQAFSHFISRAEVMAICKKSWPEYRKVDLGGVHYRITCDNGIYSVQASYPDAKFTCDDGSVKQIPYRYSAQISRR